MHFNTAVALVGTCLTAVQETPAAADLRARADPLFRLVKMSESDSGEWVTEKQIYERFVSRKVGFLDIMDRQHVSEPKLAARQAATSFPKQVQHKYQAGKLISEVSIAQPQGWLQTLTNFHTRHHESPTGKQAATWLFNEAKTVAAANPAINVSQFQHSWDQPSVIARIPGNSSNLVIVGAHFDSTGGDVQARSPGADNGSGTVVVLEALRVFAKTGYKPQNTLDFHFYAAEEAGLRGSMDISSYKSTGKRVLAMLNQDGTSHSPNNQSSLITEYVDSGLTEYVRTVATAYMDRPPTSTHCNYAFSDHSSATQNGFPSAMLAADKFETVDTNVLHSTNDSLEKVQWPTVLRHAQFVVGFMVEAFNLGSGQSTTAATLQKPIRPTGRPATGQGCHLNERH